MNNHEKPTNEEIANIRSRLQFLKNIVDNLKFTLFVFYIVSIIIAMYLNIGILIALIILAGIVHYSFIFDIYEKFKGEFNAIKFENRNIKSEKTGVIHE